MTARTVAVSNQKGGVGKTTTVINLAAFASLAGKRVLVIDLDPQGNTSSVLAPEAVSGSVFSGLTPTPSAAGCDVISAGPDLIDEERVLARQDGGRFILRQRIRPLQEAYDLILIDCPPNLSWLPTNALLASTHLLLPLQSEYFAMEGLGQLLGYVEDLRQDAGADIALLGVLLTMVDPANPRSFHVEQDLRNHFGERVVPVTIPRDPALATAPAHARSILAFDPLSPGGVAYAAVTRWVLDQLA